MQLYPDRFHNMIRFKYRIGARVKILIGHPIWMGTEDVVGTILHEEDIRPDLVDKKAIIKERILTQGLQRYGLEIDDVGYISWFSCRQIERI